MCGNAETFLPTSLLADAPIFENKLVATGSYGPLIRKERRIGDGADPFH